MVAAGTATVYYHRDHARRETTHRLTDRYLHSGDGRLRTLMVACTDDIWDAAMSKKNQTTWRRTYVRKMAPYRVRFASWVIDYTTGRGCGAYTLELVKSLVFMTAMMLVVSPACREFGSRPLLIKLCTAVFWNSHPSRMAVWWRFRSDSVQILRRCQSLEQSTRAVPRPVTTQLQPRVSYSKASSSLLSSGAGARGVSWG